VLQAADLPAGYTSTPRSDDPSDDAAQQRKLVACIGSGSDTSADRVDRFDSPRFALGQTQISSDVTRWKSQNDVDANVALLNQPRTNICYQQQLREQLSTQLPTGTKVDRFDVRISPSSAAGGNVVARAKGTIAVTTSNGQHTTIELGAAFVTGRQITGTVEWVGIGQSVPTATVQAAVRAVADRFAHA
jgi:hypothetical protein